jgi:hypothetical protein
MKVICDNPPTDSDSTTEEELDDEKEEKDEDLEDEKWFVYIDGNYFFIKYQEKDDVKLIIKLMI